MTKRDPCDFDHSVPGERKLRFRPMAPIPGKPNGWRKRAAEIRALAEHVRDQWTKNALLRLAADYDEQVKEAEKRVSGSHARSAALARVTHRSAPRISGA